MSFFDALLDGQIPENLRTIPESLRRGQVITRFGLLGSVFGSVYGIFYLCIGHFWGALIIAICTSGVGMTPRLMRMTKSIEPAGHFFALVLTLGFLALSLVEGGVHGHAIAWLINAPLCALIFLGIRPAILWAAIALLCVGLLTGLDMAGIDLPVMYNPKWTPLITGMGYLGLVVFMFTLGAILEQSRARAYAQLQAALAELATKNERLQYLNKEKNEIVSIAAHDLKGPLSVILGSGGLLPQVQNQEKIVSIASSIVAAAKRMHHLITNLLDVHAIEEGLYASRLERCDLADLVHQAISQNSLSAEQKRIRLQVQLSEILLVRADRAAAVQILDNLISNAIKYSPLDRSVHIQAEAGSFRHAIVVRDEGPGISESDQKKLFQKFCRLSAQPTGGESSTGLGLAIAKRLTEALSGSLHCKSELGDGSTFTLELPVG